MRTTSTILLMLCCIPLFADNTESYLKQLDQELERSAKYTAWKEQRIDSLKTVLSRATGYEQLYDQNWALYQEYRPYQLDSAGTYLKRAEVLAKQQHDSLRIVRAHLNFAPIFFQSGLYKSSIDLLSDWRQRSLHGPLELKTEYFRQCVSIYSSMLNNNIEPQYTEVHVRRLRSARDSLLQYQPDDWSLKAEKLSTAREFEKAIQIYHEHVKDDDHSAFAALSFYGMARIYGLMGDRKNQEKYLALSAINDMRKGVREYRSLTELALLLHEDGDEERAARYLHRSLQDAVTSNAGLRSVENQKVYGIIAEAHEAQQNQIKNLYKWLFVLAILLLGLAIAGTVIMHRRNRQLRTMHSELAAAHEKLAAGNDMRRNYIRKFIDLCQGYLEKMENHRKALSKVAARRNFDELYDAVKSTRYINQEIEDFYALFDEAFLQIYPDFIEKVNALLRPEEQIVLENEHRMNTELRMLALLHHGKGVTDSTEVAKFLRCSHSTVYNYRTRMRNRAINRDTFEEDVAAI